jgi:hypothetical protein
MEGERVGEKNCVWWVKRKEAEEGEHMNNVVTAWQLFLESGSDAANANG